MVVQRAVVINEAGPASVLKLVHDYPVPERQPGEVLVRIVSTSINPIDYKVRKGLLNSWAPLPPTKVLGGELGGIVQEADPESKFKVGDKVFALTGTAGPQTPLGTYQEYFSVTEDRVVHIPDNLPVEVAGAVPLAALTAWQALEPLSLKPGQRVLVLAAAGGVGHYAVQFAKAYGAHVIGTAGPTNQEFLKEIGVDEPINYRTQTIDDAAANGPFDVVVDLIGGEEARAAYKHLKRDGLFGHIYNSGTEQSFVGEIGQLHAEGKGPRVINIITKSSNEDLSNIANLIAEGKVKVTVQKTFTLETIQEAHEFAEKGTGLRGKLVIKVTDP